MNETLTKDMSYSTYRSMIDELLSTNKTTGDNHSEAMLHYTKMNVQRMKRWDKTITISESLKEKINALDKKLVFITFSEAWCGDAAHNVPVIEKIAQQSDKIEHRILLRDENPAFFENYLYNNTRSIPRLVIFTKDTNEELATWGPRPVPAQDIVMENKKTGELSYEDLNLKLQKWYSKDKSHTMQSEFEDIFSTIIKG